MSVFTKEDSQFVYSLNGKEIYKTDELAFCFDEECGTLLKHGSKEQVSKYARVLRKACVKAGSPQFGSVITVISSDDWDLATINRFVDCTGSILRWYKEQVMVNG